MSLRIIVDSACDFTPAQAERYDVDIIPLKTTFGEEEFLDGIELSHEAFFEKLIETDVFPHTSQIPPFEYEERFKEIAASGDTAICITISSGLSGCYQNALLAAQDYADIVRVVDSENACIGEGILVELAVRLRKEGCSLLEIEETLNREKKNIRLIALLHTLEYLKKGGRISAAEAMVGSVLSIKPVIAITGGAIKVLGKARGSKNGNNLLTELVEKEGGVNLEMPYSLAYSGLSDALLQKYLADHTHLYEGQVRREDIPVCSIGSAIGTHIGPGAIGVAFFVS